MLCTYYVSYDICCMQLTEAYRNISTRMKNAFNLHAKEHKIHNHLQATVNRAFKTTF